MSPMRWVEKIIKEPCAACDVEGCGSSAGPFFDTEDLDDTLADEGWFLEWDVKGNLISCRCPEHFEIHAK